MTEKAHKSAVSEETTLTPTVLQHTATHGRGVAVGGHPSVHTGKPRSGYLYKRWRGKRLKPDSPLEGVFYIQFQIMGERKTLCLHTTQLDEALDRADSFMAGKRHVSTKELYLKALIKMGDDARRELNKTIHEAPDVALPKVWESYVASRKRPRSGPRTLAGYAAQWKRFADWLPQGCKTLGDVTPGLCEEYVREFEKDGVKGSTIGAHITALRLVFKVLRPEERNPWSGVSTMLDTQANPYRRLWIEEVRKIYRKLTGEWRGCFLVGYTCGQRLHECATLSWSQIDLKALEIRFTPAKTRRMQKRVVVPILPMLARWLLAVPPKERTGYVFPSIAAKYLKDQSGVSKVFKQAFTDCEVKDDQNGKASFHSLRHTWETMMDEAGVARAISRSVTAHATNEQADRYSHVQVAVVRKMAGRAIKSV